MANIPKTIYDDDASPDAWIEQSDRAVLVHESRLLRDAVKQIARSSEQLERLTLSLSRLTWVLVILTCILTIVTVVPFLEWAHQAHH